MKKLSYAVAAAISVFGIFPASAGESLVLGNAGLSLPSVEIPSPGTPRNNQWQTLRKIKLNTAKPDMNDSLIGLIEHGQDAYAATRELYQAGFKVKSYQDNSGGYMVFADVTGQDAADQAVGLARYYYITEVKVGRKVYDQLFGARNETIASAVSKANGPQTAKSTFAVKMGTIKGGMNRSPVDLMINKLDWTIKGSINHYPVDLGINHEHSVITGGANASTLALKFDWSTEEITVLGNSGHSLLRYTVNWKGGLLQGYANNSPVKLEFNMGEGYAGQTMVNVSGYANHAPVSLVYNKVNGHIGGNMNNSPVDVNLVNCDLYDFLQYFFLFLNK